MLPWESGLVLYLTIIKVQDICGAWLFLDMAQYYFIYHFWLIAFDYLAFERSAIVNGLSFLSSVLRVWDVLLFEGNRVMLFRTALALLELYGTLQSIVI